LHFRGGAFDGKAKKPPKDTERITKSGKTAAVPNLVS
jgi:hypothetical protein